LPEVAQAEMSLTELHRRKEPKRTPEEARRINAHFLLTEFAAEHEAELLRKVYFGTFPTAKVFDGDDACRLIAANYLEGGASFHEGLIEAAFCLDFEGHYFHWRRNDLISYRPKLCPDRKTKRPPRSAT
jgi:hypothetical protein